MAIRNIRTLGDDILRAKAKEITEMTPRIEELIDDMFDTMYEANGVGLAAPQVGIRKRLVVIIVEGEELLARCLLHEIDHLDGIMYVDKVEGELLSTDDIEEE